MPAAAPPCNCAGALHDRRCGILDSRVRTQSATPRVAVSLNTTIKPRRESEASRQVRSRESGCLNTLAPFAAPVPLSERACQGRGRSGRPRRQSPTPAATSSSGAADSATAAACRLRVLQVHAKLLRTHTHTTIVFDHVGASASAGGSAVQVRARLREARGGLAGGRALRLAHTLPPLPPPPCPSRAVDPCSLNQTCIPTRQYYDINADANTTVAPLGISHWVKCRCGCAATATAQSCRPTPRLAALSAWPCLHCSPPPFTATHRHCPPAGAPMPCARSPTAPPCLRGRRCQWHRPAIGGVRLL